MAVLPVDLRVVAMQELDDVPTALLAGLMEDG